MKKLTHLLKALIGVLLAATLVAQAQIAQSPLLTQSALVEPNFVLMLDDSGSMYYGTLYEYGGTPNYLGNPGPATQTYAAYSPDVNRIYYDPRILYKTRIDANGNSLGAGATNVYVVDQACDPQTGGSNCFHQNGPETTTTGTYTIKAYFYKNSTGSTASSLWPGTGNDPSVIGSYFTPSYTPNSAEVVAGSFAVYPNTNSSPLAPITLLPKFIARTDCVASTTSCSWTEERQNYANWLAYHSNRMRMAKTGLGLAFQPLGPTFRLGWSTINNLESTNQLYAGVQLYDSTTRASFFSWLNAFDNSATPSGTPSRGAIDRIGTYYRRADNQGPWASTPSKVTSTANISITSALAADNSHLSCRRSYSMLLTDGYWNNNSGKDFTNSGASAPGNADNASYAAIPRGPGGTGTPTFSYSPSNPYQDSGIDTMADVAFKYWITDLRPDLDNNVKTVTATVSAAANPSYWQNMGFYAIGLGLSGTLAQTPATLASLTSGATSWPTVTPNTISTIDDMWHATVNARGKLLSARNADQLHDAVEQMMSEVNKVASSQSGVAASTASLKTGTKKYTPRYTTGSWIGDVVATNLDAASGADTSVAWQVAGTDPATGTSYNGIPAFASRNIYAWNGLAMGSFNYASNPYVQANVVGASANLINYLRGDQSNEDPNGTALYRPREKLLGDIVNSSPVFIKGDLDMIYDRLPAGTYGQSTYRAFVNTKIARPEGMLFAGANDGMLHGFRDNSGVEAFAFVPRAVIPNMHLLASKSYTHKYYVDGPLVEADACLTGSASTCTTWSNLLLGTLGAGGKSVFAVDVTGIASGPTMGLGASSVTWEITTTSAGNVTTTTFANLGNILSDVQTGLTIGGQWVAVFGNGYYGADGIAHLYVADLGTGALIKDIPAGVTGSNGLGGVTLVRDANQRIIGAYAGDLKGNLWKFDLSNASSSSWGLGLSGSPLYNASSAQPITAPPTVVAHPNGGRVVAFGTGKLFDTTDITSATTQSLYGVWDSVAFGTSTTPLGVTQTGVTSLVQQTVSAAITATTVITNANLTTATSVINYFSVSQNTIDWTTKRGWYINLPNTGQRVTNPLSTLAGSFVLVDTVSPSGVSLDPCVQTGTGKAWNYVINGLTGAGPSAPIFDTNGDGKVTSTDGIYSGYENSADGRTRVIKNDVKTTSTLIWFTPLSTQQQPGFGLSCVVLGNCAAVVTKVVKRTWRQLFLR